MWEIQDLSKSLAERTAERKPISMGTCFGLWRYDIVLFVMFVVWLLLFVGVLNRVKAYANIYIFSKLVNFFSISSHFCIFFRTIRLDNVRIHYPFVIILCNCTNYSGLSLFLFTRKFGAGSSADLQCIFVLTILHDVWNKAIYTKIRLIVRYQYYCAFRTVLFILDSCHGKKKSSLWTCTLSNWRGMFNWTRKRKYTMRKKVIYAWELDFHTCV